MSLEKTLSQKLCNYINDKYFKSSSSDQKLLDIGSGKGNHLVGFSRNNIKVYGIDKEKNAWKC